MADKSFWQGIGNKFGAGTQGAAPLPTSARKCPRGHALSGAWKECPYCKAEDNASSPSARANTAAPPVAGRGSATRVNPAQEAAPGYPAQVDGRRVTKLAEDAGGQDSGAYARPSVGAGSDGGSRRPTRVSEPEADTPQAAPRRANEGRRLTGALATFSWSSLGRLYELHEGRNFVGSGSVAEEGGRPADVLVDSDLQMSNSHFMVLCQHGRYRISDRASTNGTFVNGELLESGVNVELADGALIQAGATLFAFYKILPAKAPETGPEP